MTVDMGTLECGDSPYDESKAQVGRPYDGVDARFVQMQELMDERIKSLEIQLDDMHKILILVRDTMLKADTTIATIAGEVKPTLDALMNNPMLKMLLKQGEKK